MAEKDLVLVFGVGEGTQFIGHAETRHHSARRTRCHLDVRHRARRDFLMAENQLLRDTPAKRHTNIGQHFFARDRELIALGQAHHHTERTAARNDRRLVNGIGAFDAERNDRVTAFVIGGELLFFVGHCH